MRWGGAEENLERRISLLISFMQVLLGTPDEDNIGSS